MREAWLATCVPVQAAALEQSVKAEYDACVVLMRAELERFHLAKDVDFRRHLRCRAAPAAPLFPSPSPPLHPPPSSHSRAARPSRAVLTVPTSCNASDRKYVLNRAAEAEVQAREWRGLLSEVDAIGT